MTSKVLVGRTDSLGFPKNPNTCMTCDAKAKSRGEDSSTSRDCDRYSAVKCLTERVGKADERETLEPNPPNKNTCDVSTDSPLSGMSKTQGLGRKRATRDSPERYAAAKCLTEHFVKQIQDEGETVNSLERYVNLKEWIDTLPTEGTGLDDSTRTLSTEILSSSPRKQIKLEEHADTEENTSPYPGKCLPSLLGGIDATQTNLPSQDTQPNLPNRDTSDILSVSACTPLGGRTQDCSHTLNSPDSERYAAVKCLTEQFLKGDEREFERFERNQKLKEWVNTIPRITSGVMQEGSDFDDSLGSPDHVLSRQSTEKKLRALLGIEDSNQMGCDELNDLDLDRLYQDIDTISSGRESGVRARHDGCNWPHENIDTKRRTSEAEPFVRRADSITWALPQQNSLWINFDNEPRLGEVSVLRKGRWCGQDIVVKFTTGSVFDRSCHKSSNHSETSGNRNLSRSSCMRNRADMPKVFRRMAMLRHPNIDIRLAWECMHGGSLEDLFRSKWKQRSRLIPFAWRPSVKLSRKWMGDILRGMSYLHALEVVHGRLRPCNVLFSNDMYTCKISDCVLNASFKTRSSNPTEDITSLGFIAWQIGTGRLILYNSYSQTQPSSSTPDGQRKRLSFSRSSSSLIPNVEVDNDVYVKSERVVASVVPNKYMRALFTTCVPCQGDSCHLSAAELLDMFERRNERCSY